MKLQSDPTIIYGLVGGKGTLGRPIMRSEIEQPTPYNTYVIDGLPPGPIANPGRAALEAVANPARTRDLYFVADGTGGHAFAETLRRAPEERRQAARDREAGARTTGSNCLTIPPAAAPAQADRRRRPACRGTAEGRAKRPARPHARLRRASPGLRQQALAGRPSQE